MPGKTVWTAILKALPAHWRVDDPKLDAGRDRWIATATSEESGDAQPPKAVSGTGEDALSALADLAVRLPDAPHPAGSSIDQLQHVRLLARRPGEGESPIDHP